MTNILRKIVSNRDEVDKKHLAIENKPFLLRYVGKTSDPLTLLDHYRHLVQLKEIYRVFAELLTDLPDHLQSLLQRAQNIDKDLIFLDPHVVDENKVRVNLSTQAYVKILKTLPKERLLMHFLVSILGDLNGGQFLKTIVRDLYIKHGLIADRHDSAGTQFYIFEKSMGSQLTEWLRSFIPFNDDDSPDYGQNASVQQRNIDVLEAFRMQTTIVEELEATRKTTWARFFKTAAFVGGVALAAGIAINRLM